ncbi:E3 ubiquitin-protein ligase Topor [Amazona aestiva]|uniref:RING-type E3 ubiquitin transferase n=1 Tax=Amazona aestiva TaxID=12930 RepID=A0A0Q3UPX7_AMAAE|nr:E3 ubiquitin-protein ligase Topor [Amazona aestiva]
MALETRCPICLDSSEEGASYVLPCLHQFCYTCILQWSENSPECPLCRRRMTSIMQSGQGDDNSQEHVISPPSDGEEPSGSDHERGGAPGQPTAQSHQHSAASQPQGVVLVPRHPVAGLCPHIWAYFFQHDPSLLRPLMPWLRQWLYVIFQGRLWESEAARMFVLFCLEFYGLDEEPLVQVLQSALGEYTRDFVGRLIDITVERCSGEVRQRLGLDDSDGEGREVSPAANAGPAASGGGSLALNQPTSRSEAELPSTSSAALHGALGSAPSVPPPGNREPRVPQEGPEETAPGPSAGSQGSPAEARRAPKRKASRCGGPSQHPPKKPPRHQ